MNDDKAARLAAIRAANAAKRQGDARAEAAPLAMARPAAPDRPRTAAEPESFADLPPAIAPQTFIGLLVAAIAGAFSAIVLLPAWLPGLSESLLGAEPKAYWYLARSSAFVAYLLLWLAMVFGLLITNKLARAWPGGPTAFELHQHASLLGLAFALFHGLILLGDTYLQSSLAQVLTPFGYSGYEPFWVGLGQLAFYGLAIVGLSFYVKDRIGRNAWRALHFVSFLVFALALAHGIWSGSDSQSDVARALYWSTGASILFLTIYRVLASYTKKHTPQPA